MSVGIAIVQVKFLPGDLVTPSLRRVNAWHLEGGLVVVKVLALNEVAIVLHEKNPPINVERLTLVYLPNNKLGWIDLNQVKHV